MKNPEKNCLQKQKSPNKLFADMKRKNKKFADWLMKEQLCGGLSLCFRILMTSHDQIGYWILGFVNPMLGIFAAKHVFYPRPSPPPQKKGACFRLIDKGVNLKEHWFLQ